MSYIALARKWRPQTFDELVGQEATTKAIRYALSNNRVHHAYLFTGTRGVGKTTIARILAKSFNCEQGVSATPCGTCQTCQAIESGQCPDVIEVDAASKTKVEDTRAILDTLLYKPTNGRYKVFIIDEVHMLSGHSFNALLKSLEEPPSYIKFILATTEPKKIPATIQSRCIHFHLNHLNHQVITEQLSKILTAEKLNFENKALETIATSANGSLRDALSLLDQIISFCEGNITQSQTARFLGLSDEHTLNQLIESVFSQDTQTLLEISSQIGQSNADYANVIRSMITCLYQIAVIQAIGPTDEDQQNLITLAQDNSKDLVQILYQMALMGLKDFELAPSQKVGFDMLMLRLANFKILAASEGSPTNNMPSPASKAKTAPASIPTPSATSPKRPVPTPPSSSVAVSQPQKPVEASSGPTKQPSSGTTMAGSGAAKPSVTLKAQRRPVQSAEKPQAPSQAASPWEEITKQLKLDGMMRAFVNHCHLKSMDGPHIHLELDKSQTPMLTSTTQQRLQAALNQYIGEEVVLKITPASEDIPSPAAITQAKQTKLAQERRDNIMANENVQALVKTFDGEIMND